MSLFIENVDRYVRIPFKANVLLVHHSGHTVGRARGSSALKAALDAEYMVEKDDHYVTLTPTKMKDAELPPSITLQFKKVELGEFNGEVMHSAMLSSVQDNAILIVGKRMDGRAIHVIEVITYINSGLRTTEDLINSLDCNRKGVVEILGRLVGRGLIAQNASAMYELTDSGEALVSTTGINLIPKSPYHYKGSID
jgi:hypothetical protein